MFTPSSFPCPNCREFINDSMQQCPFCSAPVDPQVAQAAVAQQARINEACNDASLVRNLAGAMWLCFFLRFVPLLGCFAGLALLILFFIVAIRLTIWQAKYGSIQTADVDYRQAKRNALIALVLWILMIVVPVILIFLMAGVSVLLNPGAR